MSKQPEKLARPSTAPPPPPVQAVKKEDDSDLEPKERNETQKAQTKETKAKLLNWILFINKENGLNSLRFE